MDVPAHDYAFDPTYSYSLDELRAAKKQIKDQQRELDRKDKALAEHAAIATLKRKVSYLFQDHEDD